MRAAPLLALSALLWGCPTVDPEPPALDPIVDPLSRPASPTHSVSEFSASTACVGCHPDQVRDWQGSSHAFAMDDPVFAALVSVRQQDFDGAQDSFCLQCHSAIGTRSGEITPGFDFEDLSPVTREGVTCEACHKVSELARPYNSGHVLDPGGPMRGPYADPDPSPFHDSARSELLGEAAFCGGCHDVQELDGLPLERPFEEWSGSPAESEGRPCQTCHMPGSVGRAATSSSRDRPLRSHRFVGAEVPLLPGWLEPEEEELRRQESDALLRSAASLQVTAAPAAVAGQLDVFVTVQNDIDAHNLPTGSTFLRQLWVELVATGPASELLYRTGDLDANGDLRDHWSTLDPYGDPDLLVFHSTLLDAQGDPELFPWRASEHVSQSLSPLYARTASLFVPLPTGLIGPVHIEARLRYRSHPPFLLRALGLDALLDAVRIVDVDAVSVDVPVGP